MHTLQRVSVLFICPTVYKLQSYSFQRFNIELSTSPSILVLVDFGCSMDTPTDNEAEIDIIKTINFYSVETAKQGPHISS
jgi:hypothetical protein